MKLYSITLENFRVFKEPTTFEFKPLTILTGPNSSGKSTVVKALMLLQENLKAPNYLGRLTFKGGGHGLGDFKSVLTRSSDKKLIKFKLKYELNIDKREEDKNSQTIWDEVQFLIISYKFKKDNQQEENGILVQLNVDIINEAKKSDEEKIINIFEVNRNDSFNIKINFKWLTRQLLSKKQLFPLRPNHTIYEKDEKLRHSDFEKEFKRRRTLLDIEKNKYIESIEDYESWDAEFTVKFEDIISNIIYIKQLIANYKIQLQEISITENKDKKLQELTRTKEELEKQLDDIIEKRSGLNKTKNKEDKERQVQKLRGIEEEAKNSLKNVEENLRFYEEKKSLENIFKNAKKELDKNEDEDKESDLLEEVEKAKEEYQNFQQVEKAKIEDEIEDIKKELTGLKKELIDGIEEYYKSEKSKIDRGKIRTEVYNLVMKTCREIIHELSEIKDYKEFPIRRAESIGDILKDGSWKSLIEEEIEKMKDTSIIDLVNWTEGTDFIRKILKEDENQITLGEVVVDNYGSNQLSLIITDNIGKIISKIFTKLPFTYLSSNRGIQKRFYRTAKPQYHLENALSTLLSLQYNKDKNQEKLNFIQDWARQFNILEDYEILKAESIDGDFVKGYIADEAGNEIVNIADLGLGIAQLIPIIIYTADAIGSNQLICIEEPGTHLHPDLQELLIEFFKAAHDKNINFLIETHSGALINTIHYLLREEEQLISAKDFGIYFIENSNLNKVKCEDEKGIEGYYLHYWKRFLGKTAIKERRERKELESNKAQLNKRLKELKVNIKCIVLSEDEDLSFVKKLLWHSGFNEEETEVRSYKGCGNLSAALELAKFIKERFTKTNIVIHRDRDYLHDDEVKVIEDKLLKRKIKPFITDGTDIESYFLCSKHIRESCQLSKEEAEILLNKALEASFDISCNKFCAKEFGGKHKDKKSHLKDFIVEKVKSDKRFIYGKEALDFLKGKLRGRGNITAPSKYIEIEQLQSIAKEVWNL